jgi:hypothetical protein
MAYLTIFSAPKAFTDPHIATIQRNAIKSWTKIPNTAVILLGDEPGLAEAARELGVKHIQDLPRSPSGAPLMDAMFQLARENSPSPLYCIVNTDIILFPNLVEIATKVAAYSPKFVLMGQRWDMDITSPIDFSGDWPAQLRASLLEQGKLHRPAGSDYFIFHNSCYKELPPFVIGRAGWDNWMIYHARKSGFPAIDGTLDITIIHQNHDYSHLPGGQPHYDHPETDENIRLAGGRPMTRFTLIDATHRLVKGHVIPQLMDSAHLWRRIEAWPLLALNSTRLSDFLWRAHKWLVNE